MVLLYNSVDELCIVLPDLISQLVEDRLKCFRNVEGLQLL